MKNIVKDKMLLLIAAVFICSMNFPATSQAQTESIRNEKGISSVAKFKIDIPDFANTNDDKVKEIARDFSSQRLQIGGLLVRKLEEGKDILSNAQKTGIIDMLGSMRYVHAVSVLIENINFERVYIPENAVKVGEMIIGAMSPLDPYADPHPANTALIEIGEPASKYILSLLDEKQSDLPTTDYLSSRSDGFAEVLFHIEGPRYGLLKLEDHQQAATDPQVKSQYQMVIDRFKKIVVRTQ